MNNRSAKIWSMASRRRTEPARPDQGAASPDDSPVNGGSRRAPILEAAIAEFAAKGFAGARVAEIARLSKSNKQLIYHYFESKRGLYEAAVREMIWRTNQAVDATDADTGSESYAEVVRRKHALPADPNDWRYRFWLWEALDSGDRDIPNEAERRELWRTTVDDVRAAQRRGEVDPALDPELVCLTTVAIMQFPHLLPQVTKLITGVKHDTPEFRERRDAMLGQFLERLAPKKRPAKRRPPPSRAPSANGKRRGGG
jgi:AcrR family transcriptional regulator